MKVKPFKIAVAQADIDDLTTRLERARWPDEPRGAGWSMGTNLAFMHKLVKHWREKFDWRAQERALNALPNYHAEVGSHDIHFIHQPSADSNATPLLLLHGWPDSNYRYAKVVPLLAQAKKGPSFHVVVPSLPGFGFSTRHAMNSGQMAGLVLELMRGLGYQRFLVAGGDVGAFSAMAMAGMAPDALLGMHLTEVGYPDEKTDFRSLTPEEQKFAQFIKEWWMREGAYNMVQSTKPQSLAFAMNDSPVGLAAWIISFMTIDTQDKVLERFTMDELLTNISILWFTQTAPSSMRVYYENAKAMRESPPPSAPSPVPAAVLHMPWDAPLPRAWARRRTNLLQYAELDSGGHFAAWEKPEEYVANLQKFAVALEAANA